MSLDLYGPAGTGGSVQLYGPSGTDTDIFRLILDLATIVKSLQLGYYMAPGAVTDEKVAADAAIAQSKIANLIADLAARATDAELAAEAAARTTGDTAQATSLGNHLADTVDAHDASAVSVVPAGGLAATNAQAALVELDADITAEATARAAGDNSRLPLAGGTLTGPLTLAGDALNALQAVPKQQLDAAVASGVPDASTTVKGKVQLAGDLAGTAAAPTVPGLATEATARAAGDAAAVQRANHTGTQLAATISDLTEATQDAVGGALTDTATLDLTYNDAAGTISGAVLDSPTVAGATPAQLRDRSTHTGAQAESTVTGLVADLAARALDSAVVHNTGAETIAGVKTFSAAPVVPAGALPESAVANLTADLAAKLPLAGGTMTGALTLAGDAAAALQAVPKQQLDAAVAAATIPDATTTVKGKLQLAGDLAGTAAAPTVPGLATRALDSAVVHNTGAETIAGVKTFSAAPVLPAGALPESAVANLTTDLAARAVDSAVVHNTGAETIAGVKTFSAAPVLPAGALPESAVANLTTDLAARALDSAVVHNTGAETVAGVKTFSSAPVVPAAAFPESAVANLTTDLAARALDAAVVHSTGAETIAGVKTFSAAPVVPAASFPESAVANLTTDLAAKLPLAGGTLTGSLVLAANAAAALQPVPLQQLDAALLGVRAGTIYVDDYIAAAGATTTTQITNAIKAALAAAKAAGKWCEFAPRAYTVNQSLDPANTLIRAYGATVTLAAGSNCYLLACSAGANVTIFGGLWDGNNNAGQQTTGVGFIGYGFYLVAPGPAGLTGKVWLKDLEVRNCIKWAISISAAQEVRWENLRFATQSDGIHIHGPCALVYGRGTHGTTADDMVACTTSDYPANVTTEGDFGLIDIDGLYQAGAAPSFAFLGKIGTKAEVINLRNVRGTAGGMAVRITNDAGSSGNLTGTVVGSLTIDGIEVDNANSVSPIINLNPTRIRNVVITNFIHRNTGIPILVDTAGVVESLKVNGYSWKPLASAPSEVQTIGLGSATAGTVTVTFDGATTAAIAYNANAAAIQAALVALANVDAGDITVTGGPWPATATLTWGGRFVGKWQPKVAVTPTGLTGGTVAVAVTVEGGGVAQPLVQNLGRCDELVFESVAATFVSGGKVFQNSGSIHRVSMSNMQTSGGTAVLVQTNTSTPMDVFEANSQFRNLEYGHIIGAVCNLYLANLKFNVIGNYLFYLNDTAGRLRVLAGVIEQVGVTLPQAMAGAATISGNGEMVVMDATGGNQINAARAGDRVWDRITNKPVLYNGSAWVAAY